MGFPDQATVAVRQAVAAALNSGRSFPVIYVVSFAALPIALWAGAEDEVRRLLDLLYPYSAGYERTEQWGRCFERVLKLRAGNESDVLIASFIAPRADGSLIPPFAGLPSDANISVPLPGPEPVDIHWNTPELLRVDAELLLWHDAPGAAAAAEGKLLRALQIAREQTALSWELRAAMSLAGLWRRHGQTAEARDLLTATYGKFTEGFGTCDLVQARKLMLDLEADRPPA
jgi:hypothetical protein